MLSLALAALLGGAALAAGSYHSMYARLGGYAGVRSLSTDVLGRLAADPKLSTYFQTVTPAERAALAKYAADYACKAAGAGCTPEAPRVSLVTSPPNITPEQKQAAISDLKQTLEAHNVPADIQSAILQAAR
jgi:truncated hemoglobin YjbI